MSESSRHARVVPIQLVKHPDANSLSLVYIDGFTVVVNTQAWEGKNNAVYIQPESVVNVTRPEFSFLKRSDKNRDEEVVTVRKFRGIWSQGLLVPTPPNFVLGDDCWEYFGLKHYEPAEPEEGLKSGNCTRAPSHWSNLGKYDVENIRKYNYLFQEDELVNCMEKINGSNMSCVYSNGAYYVKSRNFWKMESEFSDFWKALNSDENLKKLLMDNPDHLIQGELTGKVGGFRYGLKNGQVKFFAFDIRKPDYSYMDIGEFYDITDKYEIKTPKTPTSSRYITYNFENICELSEGLTLENDTHIREGIVVRPRFNRYVDKLNGRLILKSVSNTYLEKTS